MRINNNTKITIMIRVVQVETFKYLESSLKKIEGRKGKLKQVLSWPKKKSFVTI